MNRNVEVERDVYASLINTGFIKQQTDLTVNVIVQHIDDLAELLGQPDVQIGPAESGGLTLHAAGRDVPLSRNLLKGFELLPRAADLDLDVRCRAYAAWLATRRPERPQQCVAARDHYVPLAGHLHFGRDMPLHLHLSERRWQGEGPQRQLERVPLGDVTEAVGRHPAFVLLGAPGSGKSTLLHRLVLDTARDYLTGASALLPLWITLAEYRWDQTTPLEFVARRWSEQSPGDFLEMARTGRVLLLADGLNEMWRLNDEGQRRRRATDWQRFIESYFADPDNASRAVIASRDRSDYDQPLGLPRVEIDPLKDDQIEVFLRAYLGEEAAGGAWAAIQRLGLVEHARVPYSLSVLAALYDPQGGDLPPNRGLLLAEYARRLVLAEEHVSHPHWVQPEAQLAALGELGFSMQVRSESTVLSAVDLRDLLPGQVVIAGLEEPIPTPPEDVFDLACRAGILVADPSAGETSAYKFSHQLLQEQFAARHLLTCWQAGDDLSHLWQVPRTHRRMPPADVGEWDPLPPPPPTGWEQSTILAAGMADTPDSFVRAVLAANPALAGRCITEGFAPVEEGTRADVRQSLLSDLSDPALHRRARVEAGFVLGEVGDPRFVPQKANGVEVVWPDWVYVPGGQANIGAAWWNRRADADERPRHRIDIPPFYLGKTPVTNAEYDCFIRAGGYDTERYWMPAGWQWRQGQLQESGPVERTLEFYRYFKKDPGALDQLEKEERWMPSQIEAWRQLLQLTEEKLRQNLLEQFPARPHEQPYFWDDPAYDRPNQPVVGVTWYEAMAYCAWLKESANQRVDEWAGAEGREKVYSLLGTGQWTVRLPTEVEWEWAAGGLRHATYPWGRRFDSDRVNTLEGRVLRPSPAGAYPSGVAPCGALDLSGNVWEWMYNLYRDYPYRAGDGREDPGAPGNRALRGGSWYDNRMNARVSYRNPYDPDYFNVSIGFRLVVVPI